MSNVRLWFDCRLTTDSRTKSSTPMPPGPRSNSPGLDGWVRDTVAASFQAIHCVIEGSTKTVADADANSAPPPATLRVVYAGVMNVASSAPLENPAHPAMERTPHSTTCRNIFVPWQKAPAPTLTRKGVSTGIVQVTQLECQANVPPRE